MITATAKRIIRDFAEQHEAAKSPALKAMAHPLRPADLPLLLRYIISTALLLFGLLYSAVSLLVTHLFALFGSVA